MAILEEVDTITHQSAFLLREAGEHFDKEFRTIKRKDCYRSVILGSQVRHLVKNA